MPRRPSAEKQVRALHPDARLEKHRPRFEPACYLVRYGNAFMYAGEGKTPREAWENALAKEPKETKP